MKILKNLSILATAALIASSSFANEAEKKFYVGGAIGYSKPLKNKFSDKDSGTTFHLKKSTMYTGSLGYKITPDIAVEFSYDAKPKYPIVIELSKTAGGEKVSSNAKSRIFMLNFVYDLNEIAGFQPFFTVGAGLAQVSVKPTSIPFDFTALGLPNLKGDKASTLKHRANCFAWEIGAGIGKKITDDFSINLAGKIQIAHNLKLKTRSINPAKTQANIAAAVASGRAPTSSDVAYDKGQIKKTLGVGEFTVGFNYNLPF